MPSPLFQSNGDSPPSRRPRSLLPTVPIDSNPISTTSSSTNKPTSATSSRGGGGGYAAGVGGSGRDSGRPPVGAGGGGSHRAAAPAADSRERGRTTSRRGGGGKMSDEMRLAHAIKGWAFICDMAQGLNLGKVATHTALVFFHRFFKHQGYEQHDRLLVATACIYLAAKAEERNNVKLSLIVLHLLTRQQLLPKDEVDFNAYGRHPVARDLVPKWKERVILYERDLLYTISFDLNVTHPFKALQDLMKTVRDILAQEKRGGEGGGAVAVVDHRTLFSQACKFLNDSFSLPSMVDADPGYNAALALYLTLRMYDVRPPQGKTSWMAVLGVADEATFARDCALAMRVLYSQENHRRLQVKGVEDPASIIPPPAAAASARGGLGAGPSMFHGSRRPF